MRSVFACVCGHVAELMAPVASLNPGLCSQGTAATSREHVGEGQDLVKLDLGLTCWGKERKIMYGGDVVANARSGGAQAAMGRVKVKMLPLSAPALSARMEPRIASTSAFEMVSPMPDPPSARARDFSTR